MTIPIFQVDAFASEPFRGNPAAVCPLEHWLPESVLQSIAAEMNLSETAFFTKLENGFHLRWFTPVCEVELCGHATLAAAFVIFEQLEQTALEIYFETKSGPLRVMRKQDWIILDFPSAPPQPCKIPSRLKGALGNHLFELWTTSRDYLAIFESASEVERLSPDMDKLLKVNQPGLIVTAPGRNCDFVSRFFAPQFGIPEDPVTGSAHCALVPYWSQRLGKKELTARQLSKRGGELLCQDHGNRVWIGGKAVKIFEGKMFMPHLTPGNQS